MAGELTGKALDSSDPLELAQTLRPSPEAADGALTVWPGDLSGLVVVALGIDLVDIDRMRAIVERQGSFIQRVYTENERAYCDRLRDPAERYAARFAAKEAVLKALGTGLGGADLNEIEVEKDPKGAPMIRLHGRAQVRAAELGIAGWLLTLTHSNHLAQAMVAALGHSPAAEAAAPTTGETPRS